MFERAEKYPYENMKYNWLLIVNNLLFSMGFRDVWYCQNDTSKGLFLDILNSFQQDFKAFFSTSSKCVSYRYLTNKLFLQSNLIY